MKRRWMFWIGTFLGALVGVGFFLGSRKDYMSPLQGDVIREKHEYFKIAPRSTLLRAQSEWWCAERAIYYFPEADESKLLDLLRRESTKRKWVKQFDKTSVSGFHVIFASTPTEAPVYMSDPYLLAIHQANHEISVVDLHPLDTTKIWMVRVLHPFSNPFLPQEP